MKNGIFFMLQTHTNSWIWMRRHSSSRMWHDNIEWSIGFYLFFCNQQLNNNNSQMTRVKTVEATCAQVIDMEIVWLSLTSVWRCIRLERLPPDSRWASMDCSNRIEYYVAFSTNHRCLLLNWWHNDHNLKWKIPSGCSSGSKPKQTWYADMFSR